jgi:hypothetical protein
MMAPEELTTQAFKLYEKIREEISLARIYSIRRERLVASTHHSFARYLRRLKYQYKTTK